MRHTVDASLSASPRLPDSDPAKRGDIERIALVHEWLTARAGSELLFEVLASIYPTADLFSLTQNDACEFEFQGRAVSTTLIQKLPFAERRGAVLPLMPAAWKALRRPSYPLVVSSSHAFAREFVKPNDGVHCCYVHAPMRYAWTPELDSRGAGLRALAGPARALLRSVDKRSVDRVDAFAANSSAVAQRILDFYGRQSDVIFPPVDVDYFGQAIRNPAAQNYVLAASRWIPYKRLDLAITAAATAGVDLVIAGSGPEEGRLREIAKKEHPNRVRFVVSPAREELRQLMVDALAFVFPANEDFGILPVEVQATGTPIVALAAGGSLDTVSPGKSGVLAEEQSTDSFGAALERCLDAPPDRGDCIKHAAQFSPERFQNQIKSWVDTAVLSRSNPC